MPALRKKKQTNKQNKTHIIKCLGLSSGVVFESRRIISTQKWANACWLVLRYIGLGWFIIMDIFGETSSIVQSSRHTPQYLATERKTLRQQKAKNRHRHRTGFTKLFLNKINYKCDISDNCIWMFFSLHRWGHF